MSQDLGHTCSWPPSLCGVQEHLWRRLTRPGAQPLWQLWIPLLSCSRLCAQGLAPSFQTLEVWLDYWWDRLLAVVQSAGRAQISHRVDRPISFESRLGCRSCHWRSSPSCVLALLTLWRRLVGTGSHISSRWCWVQAFWRWASSIGPWPECS